MSVLYISFIFISRRCQSLFLRLSLRLQFDYLYVKSAVPCHSPALFFSENWDFCRAYATYFCSIFAVLFSFALLSLKKEEFLCCESRRKSFLLGYATYLIMFFVRCSLPHTGGGLCSGRVSPSLILIYNLSLNLSTCLFVINLSSHFTE